METSTIIEEKNLTNAVLNCIRLTNDGNDLSPNDLYLCECAINGTLTEKGIEVVYAIESRVLDGTYNKLKNYLFGVEHITKDHECYVYYKGKHIDHFTFHGDHAGERKAAIKAAKICALLEEKGHPINSITYCWRIEEYLTAEEIAAIDLSTD